MQFSCTLPAAVADESASIQRPSDAVKHGENDLPPCRALALGL